MPNRQFWTAAALVVVATVLVIAVRSIQKSRPNVDTVGEEASSARDLNADAPVNVANVTLKRGATIRESSPIAADYASLDPSQDGWTTESVHDAIKRKLKQLAKILNDSENLDAQHVSAVVSPQAITGPLRPIKLERAFESDSFVVERPASTQASEEKSYHGIDGAITSLRELVAPLGDMERRRLDTKIIRVAIEKEVATCRILTVLSGHGTNQSIQLNATWDCRWDLKQPATPRLLGLTVTDFEQVTVRNASGPLFVDATQSVFGGNACFRDQLLPGMDYWTSRLTQNLGTYLDGWTGLAVGDINNDGLDDLYVCQPGGLPNRLFLHQADGTAVDVATKYEVDWLDRSTGALFVDLDNDGRQDLVIAIQGGVLILRNGERERFKFRQSIATAGQPYSLAAADFNDDGLLDIFVCCYNRGARSAQQGGFDVPVPYYDANNGAPNTLLANQGDFVFSDATVDAGMDTNNRRFSYAAAWEDYDNDGDQDLYVANDFGRNNLYRNENGIFTDIAAEVGVEDVGSGMSVSWSDYDGDGRMDLYVGNMFSAAGSRISYQRKFSDAFHPDALDSVRRLAQGNTLFRNTDDGTMRDVSVDSGVAMGRWSWSSNFVDLNNDGREDLVVANGFVTGANDVDL